MTSDDLVSRLLHLWDDIPPGHGAETAFRELYTDPVVVNGTPVTIAELVGRARITAQALADRSTQVLSQVVTGTAIAVAFRISARHVGPLPTPLGDITGTGDALSLQVIDVLHLLDGRIHEIWMVADYLGALGATGAISPR
jgi:predicted ester cyclase